MKNPLAIVVALVLIALGGLLYVNGDRWDRWRQTDDKPAQQAAASTEKSVASETGGKPAEGAATSATGAPEASVPGAAGVKEATSGATADSTAAPGEGKALPGGTAGTAEQAAGTVAAAKDGVAGEEPSDAPSFDIVRIEEDGTAVIAGRAKPMAKVTVRLGDKALGETQANDRGEWVVIVEDPIAPGSYNLSAEASVEGQAPVPSAQVLALALPERGEERPLIVATEPGERSRVLEKPGEEAPAVAGHRELAMDKVDYTSQGAMAFSGQAEAGAKVRFYIDNEHVADVDAGADGGWMLEYAGKIAPGLHHLRVDQLGADGQVAKRIELPFERAEEAMIAQLIGKEAGQTAVAEQGATTTDAAKPQGQSAVAEGAADQKAPAGSEASHQTAEATAQGRAPITQQRPAGQTAKSDDRLAQDVADGASAQPAPNAGAQAAAGTVGVAAGAGQKVAAAHQNAGDHQVVTPSSGQPELSPSERAVVTAHRDGKVVIQPGNNLWRIARVIYGRGIQYSVIYQANKEQIRDPDKIYPGQIFATPGVTAPERISPDQRKPIQDPS